MAFSEELTGMAPIEFTGIEDEDLQMEIIKSLMLVNDPEIHIDIVNLGLVYEVIMDAEKNMNVKMTLTAIGCPLAGSIMAQVQSVLSQLPDVNQVTVDLVWNPPWDKDRVSRFAAMALGIR